MQDLYNSLAEQQTDLTQIDENTMMEMLYNATMTDGSTDTEESKQTSAQFLQQFGGIDMVQYDLEMRKTVELLKEANK